VRVLEAGTDLSRKIVVAARLHRRQALAEAGKRQRVVADGPDVVLGLPHAAALDARARMERVDDAPAEEIRRGRRRWKNRVARRLAEQEPEARARRTELRRRRQR